MRMSEKGCNLDECCYAYIVAMARGTARSSSHNMRSQIRLKPLGAVNVAQVRCKIVWMPRERWMIPFLSEVARNVVGRSWVPTAARKMKLLGRTMIVNRILR